jgi:tetratricopeptide (TPR) repeat protein
MRSPLFILVASFVLALFVAQLFGTHQANGRGTGPDLLFAFTKRSPDLGPALAAADRGDQTPLLSWLNAADAHERQALAAILLDACTTVAGLPPNELSARGDRALYGWRRRFSAFANIPTGNNDLDAELDNLIAYLAVAGSETPSAQDLTLAKYLLPRITKHNQDDPKAPVWDTIGCVHFVAGEFAQARSAFDEAVKLGEHDLSRAAKADREELTRSLDLYRARRQAAVDADLQTVEQRNNPASRPRLPAPPETPAPLPEKAH